MNSPLQNETASAADRGHVARSWTIAAGTAWDLARGDLRPEDRESAFAKSLGQVASLAGQTVLHDVRWSAMALRPFMPILRGWMLGARFPSAAQVVTAHEQLVGLLTETGRLDPQAGDLTGDRDIDAVRATARHYTAAAVTIGLVMREENPERVALPERPGVYWLRRGEIFHRLPLLRVTPDKAIVRQPESRALGNSLMRSTAAGRESYGDALPPMPEEVKAASRYVRERWVIRETARLLVAEIVSRQPGSDTAPLTDRQNAFLDHHTQRLMAL